MHYDNFSHWALIVKSMSLTNSFPSFKTDVIMFTSYPPGSAVFIYYFINIIKGFRDKKIIKFDIIMFILILITAILNRSSSFYLAIAIVSFILLIDFWKDIFNSKNMELLEKFFKNKILVFVKKNKIKTFLILMVFLVLFAIVFRIIGFRFLILILNY